MYDSFVRFHDPFRTTYPGESFVPFVVTCKLQGRPSVKFCSTRTVVEGVEVQFEYAEQSAIGLIVRYGRAALKISFVDRARVHAANNFCKVSTVSCRTENTPPPYAARACISRTSGTYRSEGTRIR